ncbi:hypothetical protein [Candidatus Williamhamiltonella defendens]|uniref:Uncharacterized protein n=1 Tax=Candidatus Hamiltonella defensa (Bemisia tabaci) TaxID=672795 RepID=A0A249DZD9_9ENTR|nr:hypothetical protein [Candidatus Hamiltonella defensa]ASX26913.1 hypothetical protein BA171_07940 [Candidatus Hamiltonella defensa (Bemisia tabaci)]
MNPFNRLLCQWTFNAHDRSDIYDSFRHYLLDGHKMHSVFETSNQEGALERFGERLLATTLIQVERQGNVIKLVSMFGGAVSTVGIVGMMYSLIEIAFHF